MEQFRQQLLNTINSTQLPLEAVYYIFKDVYRDLNDTYYNYLKQAEAAVTAPPAIIKKEEEDKEGEE